MDLPSVAEVKRLVADNNFVVQLDGKSWFYQVPARKLQSYFALRTVAGIYWLVVLPMGWSWSVWIAQTLARAIGQRAMTKVPEQLRSRAEHAEYIDNFIACGTTREAAAAVVDGIRAAADECGAVLKDEDNYNPKTS